MKATKAVVKVKSSPSQAKAEALRVMKCKAAGCGMPTKARTKKVGY
jgi:NADPH-dependent glutamate synthase beta subunit-like oxidoreductase